MDDGDGEERRPCMSVFWWCSMARSLSSCHAFLSLSLSLPLFRFLSLSLSYKTGSHAHFTPAAEPLVRPTRGPATEEAPLAYSYSDACPMQAVGLITRHGGASFAPPLLPANPPH